jgi:hypothetical protein
VNSEMHWETVIEQVWTSTWRPRSSELRDALGGHDQTSLEMPLDNEMYLEDALGGSDQVSSEMQLATETE